MNEINGNNYDAVFFETAYEVLANQSFRRPSNYYLYRLRREVFGPLRCQGVSEETLEKLETRAKEIFNIKSGSPSFRFGRSRMIQYDQSENNVVPRSNGTRK